MNLWSACESVARQKRGLDDSYTMCAVDLLPHGVSGVWEEAHVELGVKQPKVGRQRYARWADIKRVVIYPMDVAALLDGTEMART